MKKTFTVPEVAGSKRTSERDYTHALIGQFDYDAQLKRVSVIYDVDGKNFEYYKRIAAMRAGDKELVTGCARPWEREIKQDEIDHAKEFMKKNPYNTASEYAEACRLKRIEWSEKEKAENEGKWGVLRWSMSYQNASKAIGEFSHAYKNLKVVPVIEVKK